MRKNIINKNAEDSYVLDQRQVFWISIRCSGSAPGVLDQRQVFWISVRCSGSASGVLYQRQVFRISVRCSGSASGVLYQRQVFRIRVKLPSSRLLRLFNPGRRSQSNPSKRREQLTQRQNVTSPKAWILKSTAGRTWGLENTQVLKCCNVLFYFAHPKRVSPFNESISELNATYG